MPRLDGHLVISGEGETPVPGKQIFDLNTEADEEQIMSLRPSVLEQHQRHMIWRYLHPDMYREDDVLSIDHYYADAVSAPLYYGYGEPDSFADRRERARAWDRELLLLAPGTVLVLLTASAEAIRERMRQGVRAWDILKQRDAPLVLYRFRAEHDSSLLHNKIALDTAGATAEETLRRFLELMTPFLSRADRRRMTGHDMRPKAIAEV